MNIKKLTVSLLLCFSVALLGSISTLPSITTWYVTLNKPFLTPPNWIFGPVWTFLYFLMGVSFYLIWNKKTKSKKVALQVFLIQLALNLLWSLVFFGIHMPLLAFIIILFLWAAILYTILLFLRISKPAAFLLTPYILWVSYALFLNLFIVILN